MALEEMVLAILGFGARSFRMLLKAVAVMGVLMAEAAVVILYLYYVNVSIP